MNLEEYLVSIADKMDMICDNLSEMNDRLADIREMQESMKGKGFHSSLTDIDYALEDIRDKVLGL